MPRWYRAYRTVGHPATVVETFSQFVERHDLGQYVPAVRVEKRAHRGEFYFFVALEAAVEGELPSDVVTKLASFPLLRDLIADRLSLDAIRTMVSTELEVRVYARRIAYHAPYVNPDDDPFDLAGDDNAPTDDLLKQTQCLDHLLLWLSATGSGSLDVFCTTCSVLKLASRPAEAHRIMRRLRVLGHVETSPSGLRWTVAPAALVRTAYDGGGVSTFFLAGGRDVQLLEALRNVADVEEVPQRGGMGPSTVHVTADEHELLGSLEEHGIERLAFWGCVAERMAHLLPDLPGWVELLTVLEGISPSSFDVKRFRGTIFVDDVFEWQSGFYQLWSPGERLGPQLRPKYTLFYDAPNERWLRGDWYGLRFLDLRTQGFMCPARYNKETGQLAIPEQWRWPEIYERALVLASGRLPRPAGQWLIYEAISATLVETLQPKIGLELEEGEIDA